jgi:hypothetical protein
MIFAFFWFFGDIGLFKNHHTLFIISVVIISSVLHFWIVLRHWHSRELHKKSQALNTENEAVVRDCCEEKGMSEKAVIRRFHLRKSREQGLSCSCRDGQAVWSLEVFVLIFCILGSIS